ncbi:hypothetical protein DSO57_1029116 [Entomophthora muscae]|uniref:Uncharacterized protein n=1 Tax=Entomophthora muscae TaxID=34485 RepID=A0ACC2SE39_9FUNG|nr:hypothetical protein DSO57_1029116 [Entomophthora muscae]
MVDEQLEYKKGSIGAFKLSRKQLRYPVAWKGYPASENCWIPQPTLTPTQDMLQEFHKNNPQVVGLVKATLAATKLPPAHKGYALAALIGGGKPLSPKMESSALGTVSLGIARSKHCHPGEPALKPCLLAMIVDLNLMINCEGVVVQKLESEQGADALRSIFPNFLCWAFNPNLLGGWVTPYRPTIGDVCKLAKYCTQGGHISHIIQMYPRGLSHHHPQQTTWVI